MKQKNRNIKQISNFIELNGKGTILLRNFTYKEVVACGYFKMFHWYFLVHRDIDYPECFSVSEASTGCLIGDYCYDTIEEAIRMAMNIIEDKRYYFFTSVNNILVRSGCNLIKRNTTGLQTLAIDSLWF